MAENDLHISPEIGSNTPTLPTQLPRRNKTKHRLLRVILIALTVSVFIQLTFYYFAKPILESIIKSKLTSETHGLFDIEFETIRVDLSSLSISLTGFKLTPHPEVYEQIKISGKANKALYAINFTGFYINKVNLYRLIFKNELNLSSVILDKPLIRLVDIPMGAVKKSGKYDAVHTDLYPILSKYFSSIKINRLEIKNGYFDFFVKKADSQLTSVAYNTSIVLQRFYLDANQYRLRNRLFYSDQIEVNIKDYVLVLPDSVHVLRVDNVNISTSKSEIRATKVSMLPEQLAEKYLAESKKSFYQVFVPEIKITKTDFNEIYFDRIVAVKNVELIEPQIQMYKPEKRRNPNKKKTETDDIDLFNLINGKFSLLSVDYFVLRKAGLQVFRNFNDRYPQHSINRLSVWLEKFVIDSLASQNTTKILYAKNIEITMQQYKMLMADNLHVLEAEDLYISTDQTRVYAKDVKLHPLAKAEVLANQQGKTLYDIHVPELHIRGVDLHKYYNFGILPIDVFLLQSPQVTVNQYKNDTISRVVRQKKSREEIYQLASGFLTSLQIKKLNIEQGHFDVKTIHHSDSTNFSSGEVWLTLDNFVLDPSSSIAIDRFFYADNIDLSFINYSLRLPDKLHTLSVDKLRIATIDSSFTIEGLKLKPINPTIAELRRQNKSSYFDFTMQKLELVDADIHKAYFHNKLQIPAIRIVEPIFKFTTYKGLKHNQTSKTAKPKVEPTDSTKIDSSLANINKQLDTQGLEEALQLLNNVLELIEVDKIDLVRGEMRLLINDSIGNRKMTIDNKVTGNLRNFYLNFDSPPTTNKLLYSDDIEIKLNDFKIGMPNKVYDFKANEIELSSRNSYLEIKDFRLIPKLSICDTLRIPTIFELYIPRLSIAGVNYKQMLADKQFNAESVLLDQPQINLVRRVMYMVSKTNQLADEPDSAKTSAALGIPLPFASTNIAHFDINTSDFKLFNEFDGYRDVVSTARLSLSIDGISLDSNLVITPEAHTHIPYINDLSLHLENAVFKLADSAHYITADKFDLSLMDRNIRIKNLSVEHNPTYNDLHKKFSVVKPTLLEVNIPELEIEGVDFDQFYTSKQLDISKLVLNNPIIGIEQLEVRNPNKQPAKKFNLHNINAYQAVSKFSKSIKIDELEFSNLSFSLDKQQGDSIRQFMFNRIYGQFSGFLLDSLSWMRSQKVLFSDNAKLQLKDFGIDLPNKLYSIQTAELGLSLTDSLLYVNNFSMFPLYNNHDFYQITGVQKGIINITSKHLQITHLDYDALIQHQQFDARSVIADSLDMRIFSDKTQPPPLIRNRKMPQQGLRELKKYFKLDTLLLRNSHFVFQQLGDSTKEPAAMYITDINAQVRNLTNDTMLLRKKIISRIDIKGMMMGTGEFNAHLDVPLADRNNAYDFNITLNDMDMRDLNPLLERLAFVRITDGNVKQMKIKFTGDDSLASGKMRFRYHDLQVELLDKETGHTTGSKAVVSMLANTVIRSNNPRRGRFIRDGLIYEKRNPNKPIFHQWTQAILGGLKSTLGFESKDWKREKKRIKAKKREDKRWLQLDKAYDKKQIKNKIRKKKTEQKWLKQNERHRKKELNKEKRMRRKIDRKMRDLMETSWIQVYGYT